MLSSSNNMTKERENVNVDQTTKKLNLNLYGHVPTFKMRGSYKLKILYRDLETDFFTPLNQ